MMEIVGARSPITEAWPGYIYSGICLDSFRRNALPAAAFMIATRNFPES